MKIKVEIPIEITSTDIDDIMCTALEGGVNYWCDHVEVAGKREAEYAAEEISHGGALWFYDCEDGCKYYLCLQTFLSGLAKWLSESNSCCLNRLGGNIDTGFIDAGDADCIIQYALFDEIVFG